MPTLEELIGLVKQTVLDDSFSEDFITLLLNEAYEDVAMKVLLPDLEASATVDTVVDETVASLPADFSRNLYGCAADNQRPPIKILSSMALMQARFPNIEADNLDGDVTHVTVRGSELVYHPIPAAAETLTIKYYAQITPMVAGADEPTAIPKNLQRKLLHSYACSILFDDVEDGMEGPKINTQKHLSNYVSALGELEVQIKRGQSRAEPAKDMNQWV